jgi:hypothetical protein
MANVKGIKAPPEPKGLPPLPKVEKPKADVTSTGRDRSTQHMDGKISGYGKGC